MWLYVIMIHIPSHIILASLCMYKHRSATFHPLAWPPSWCGRSLCGTTLHLCPHAATGCQDNHKEQGIGRVEACEVEVDVVFDVVVIIIIIIQVDVGFTVVMRLVCLQASLSLFPQSISVFCWDKSVFMGLRFGLYRITRTSGTGQCLLHSAYLSAICSESSAVRRRVPWQPNKFYRPYQSLYQV